MAPSASSSASCTARPASASRSNLHLNGKRLFGFRIIPDRGSWLEVQFDTNDLLYVYLDRRRRRRKFLATTFLRVHRLSGTDEEILREFYRHRGTQARRHLDEEELATKVLFKDILDGELIVARAYEPLTPGIVRQLHRPRPQVGPGHRRPGQDDLLIKSLKKDPAKDEEEALKDIYRRLRPGDPPTVPNARALLKRLFFDPKSYDLTRVGRYKINQKLGLKITEDDARSSTAGRFPRGHALSLQAPRTARAFSMTSTTSAAAACAPSANCSPTSAASALPAPSASSRSA